LNENRDQEAKKIGLHKLHSLKNEVISLLMIAKKSSEVADEERAILQDRILGESAQSGTFNDSLRILTREYLGRTRPFMVQELNKNMLNALNKLHADLQKELSSWKGGLWTLSRKFEDWLRKRFEEEFTLISEQSEASLVKPLADFRSQLDRTIHSFQHRIEENIHEVMNIKFVSPPFEVEVQKPKRPDVSFTRLYDSSIDILSFMIPMFIFRPLVERHFLKTLDYEIEKNFSRLASQWTEIINKKMTEMSSEGQKFISEQVSELRAMLETSSPQTSQIKTAIQDLEASV
jgi:hypothetical protein